MDVVCRFLMLVGVALLGACASRTRASAPAPVPVPAADANVIVYLSNQSTARRFVVLALYVDDRLAMRKEMSSVFKPDAPHDVPEAFPLRLAPGAHTIRVAVEGGVAQASVEVVAGGGTRHVDAAFWWHPGGRYERKVPERITIRVHDEEPGWV